MTKSRIRLPNTDRTIADVFPGDLTRGKTTIGANEVLWHDFIRLVADEFQYQLVKQLHGEGPWKLFEFEYCASNMPYFHFTLHANYRRYLQFDVGDSDGPWGMSTFYDTKYEKLDSNVADGFNLSFGPAPVSEQDGLRAWYHKAQIKPTALLLVAGVLMYLNEGAPPVP